MRISDWSSDVCSSDLAAARRTRQPFHAGRAGIRRSRRDGRGADAPGPAVRHGLHHGDPYPAAYPPADPGGEQPGRRAQRAGKAVCHPFRRRDAADPDLVGHGGDQRSEEHTSELQSLMRISYAVFCLKKKKNNNKPRERLNTKQMKSNNETTITIERDRVK